MNLASHSLLTPALLTTALGALCLSARPSTTLRGDEPAACCRSSAEVASTETDPRAPGLDAIAALAGTWVAVDEQGLPTERVMSEFRVTAGGNAVLETLFPGTDREMLSLYYVEDGALRLSHFCVLGNHPRMTARYDGAGDEIVFRCAGGENFADCGKVTHMHEGRTRRLADGRLETAWTPMESGRLAPEPVRAVLVRQPTGQVAQRD